MHFRNLGEKTIIEFPSKIYPLLFQNNISCLDDFRHKTANDLYVICNKDYCLTMQTYFILKKNGIIFGDWQDKFIFEILPEKKAAFLWKKHNISMLSQIPDCNEDTLKKILSSSNSFAAAMKELLSIG